MSRVVSSPSERRVGCSTAPVSSPPRVVTIMSGSRSDTAGHTITTTASTSSERSSSTPLGLAVLDQMAQLQADLFAAQNACANAIIGIDGGQPFRMVGQAHVDYARLHGMDAETILWGVASEAVVRGPALVTWRADSDQ